MHRVYVLAAIALGALCLDRAQPAQAAIFALDPSATYLLTSQDNPPHATPIELASLPFTVAVGDFLRLERLGNFDFNLGKDNGINLVAVFSSTETLLDSSNLHRVPGALDAGVDFVTGPTYFGGISNDIPEDFFVPGLGNPVTSVIVQVPTGAAYLFFSSHDSFYQDNFDPDGNYGVSITLANIALDSTTSSAPAPSSLLVFAVGAATVASWRQLRAWLS